ncbi:hypothetical protein MHU86_19098 [Fragilaria crotonensis]|nr:hypothetical protein MHU86_19098 [Fragilaria crotonensis]
MGNSSAKPQLTEEQVDIKYLGGRYPFGDDELFKLYRSFHHLLNERQEGRYNVSFLTYWAVESVCTVLPPPRLPVHLEQSEAEQGTEAGKEQTTSDGTNGSSPETVTQSTLEEAKQERFTLMQIIETKILPPGFSDLLEKTNFYISPDSDRMGKVESFFQGVSNLGRKGGRQALSVLFDCYAVKKDSVSTSTSTSTPFEGNNSATPMVADFNLVLTLAYRLSLAAAFLDAAQNGDDMQQWIPSDNLDQTAIKGLCHSLVEFVKLKRLRESPYGDVEHDPDLENGFVEKLDMQEFAEYNLPVLSSALSFFMFQVFFPEKPYPPSRTAFRFPKLSEDSTFFEEAASPLLFSFASLSTSLGGSWYRLYTSSHDGLSFNRLQNSLLGYAGPTLIIIRATNGGIFGAFTASAWKETKDFYGSSDCFLYQLIPVTAVYRPSGGGTNFMYCNSEARSRGYDAQAHGIGFGGDVHKPRLFISETFENCIALSQDMTFQHGLLLPKTPNGGMQTSFDIDSLEVWGVGGDEVVAEALGARYRQREITEANLRKARKVDKAAFLDDFRGGIIESKAFAHRDQIRGRADAAIDERNGKNSYVYEK